MIPLATSVLISTLSFFQSFPLKDTFIVSGEIRGIENGTVIMLDVASRDTLAQSAIRFHQFKLIADCPEFEQQVIPAMLLFVQHDHTKSVSIPLVLECAQIEITIPEDNAPFYTGTPLQDRFAGFINDAKHLNAQLFDRSTGDIVDSIQNQLTARTEQFYLDNKGGQLDAFLSLMIADIISRGLADPTDFKAIPRMCEDSSNTRTIYEQAICEAITNYTKTWEGANPLEITGTTSTNEDFRLTKLVGSKIIILDFWASWCGPCIKEMPSLKTLYDTMDIEIVGISIDRRQHDWIAALNKHQLSWINIRDSSGEIAKAYNVTAVPAKFVISQKGIIVMRNPEDLEAIILELKNK